jgi:hypothetical protein
VTTSRAANIPERPERLTFPPLRYEPPEPGQFRVALASGPVAYVVPDRELPLVNIVVSVRKSRGRDIRAACGQLAVEGRRKSPAQRLADAIHS